MNSTSKQDWIWEWERQAHPIIIYQIAKTYASDPAWPFLHMSVMFISEGQVVNGYFSGSILKLSSKLVKIIQKDKSFLMQFKKLIAQEAREIRKYGIGLEKISLDNASNSELRQQVINYNALYRQHGVVPIRIINKAGPEFVAGFLKQKVEVSVVPEILTKFFAPTQLSLDQKSEIDLLKIAQKIGGRANLKTSVATGLIEDYLQNYSFLPCGYADEAPYQKKDVISMLKHIYLKQEHIPHLINKIYSNIQKAKLDRARIIKKYKLPSKVINVANCLSEFIFYKDYIRMNYNFLHYRTKPLFSEIAKRFGASRYEIRYLSVPEIIESLRVGKINKKLISERKQSYVCRNQGQRVVFETGKKAEAIKNILTSEVKSASIIKGVGASGGVVIGKVFVIKKIEQTSSFPKGAIMVTTMTTPELVPIAKKSKAIITDEGGITCHAAIVSRELHIPCVIGTKIATKVLKDGDMVEVDANKGIIKIIK